jgi:hypothetical protein
VELPLFHRSDHHQLIWNNLSEQQLAQLVKLISRMLLEYQKFQGENKDE